MSQKDIKDFERRKGVVYTLMTGQKGICIFHNMAAARSHFEGDAAHLKTFMTLVAHRAQLELRVTDGGFVRYVSADAIPLLRGLEVSGISIDDYAKLTDEDEEILRTIRREPGN